ncbi:MAG: hypothetical protein IJY93_00235 [Clostridia bacterium]|nr:hypothetical protein [Clostridia bacterium]
MKNYTIKTVLTDGEKILFCHLGTIMTGTRVSGNIIVTNKRLIWERKTGLSAAGIGVLALTGKKELIIPNEEIDSIIDYWIPFAAGVKLILKSGQMYKFQINGKKPKQAREEFKRIFLKP